ncbi:MAG TPA: hypothetical protein VG323_18370, partial [Thermoanaerobaculia bacterium]|nr:hypothetical protein [Thermoanaerobaculia bacterium]
LVGITGRRIVLDWVRLVRQRRQIGISALSVPLLCTVVVGTRLLELAGGFAACAKLVRFSR